MLLKTENTPVTDYLENWPAHYYEIEDIDLREQLLLFRLEANAGDREDQRRLTLLRKRYPSGSRPGKARKDGFVAAWMGLLIEGRLGTNFLNRKRQEKEIRRCLTELCVLDESFDAVLEAEWRQFAALWIRTCIGDHSYGSTVFGLFRLGDERIGKKIASEIYEVTTLIPARFGLRDALDDFRRVMKECYLSMIEHSDRYWADAVSASEAG